MEEVLRKIDSILSGRGGIFSLMARNFETGEEICVNPDVMLPAASVFKVPVLVELYRKASLGQIDLAQKRVLREEDKSPGSGILKEMTEGLEISLRDLGTLMIIISDNTAADMCLEAAGLYDVNATMHRLGLKSTFVSMGCKGLLAHCAGIKENWPTKEQVAESFRILESGKVDYNGLAFQGCPENNVTTARDMVDLMEALYKAKGLPKEVCENCLSVMKKQQLRDRIPGLLPLGTITMTKSGTLGVNVVVNDVGIVQPANSSAYAIAILTKQEPRDDARQVPALLSKVVYDYFTRE
ncbi:MAG TPA: serine hydrolase [Firmicutes bacterium]|nr:serine hydrolase [Candidatus Fermentithermobacillaceae bacterium]